MLVGRRAARCVQWVFLSLLLQGASPFLIYPGHTYWLSHSPLSRRTTRVRPFPPQPRINRPSQRSVIPLAFRPPRQSSVPSPPSVATHYTFPSQPLPFSPWRGKRGVEGAAPLVIHPREFSPWKGKRSGSFVPRNERPRGESEHFPAARAVGRSLSATPGVRASAVTSVKGHSPGRTRPPSEADEQFGKGSPWKRPLRKRSIRLQSPMFSSQERSQAPFTDLGFKSSSPLSDPSPSLSHHHEELGKLGEMASAPNDENKLWAWANRRTFDEEMSPPLRYGKSTGDRLKTVDEMNGNEELTSGLHDDNEHQSTFHGEKVRTGFDDLTMILNREQAVDKPAATSDDTEPLSHDETNDQSDKLNANLSSDNLWQKLLQEYDLDALPLPTGTFQSEDGQDLPTSVLDYSQPWVGPFFWVDNVPDSENSDGRDAPDGTGNALALSEGFQTKQQQPDTDSDRHVSGHSTKQDTEGEPWQKHQRAFSFPVADAPRGAVKQTVNHRSESHASKTKTDTKPMCNSQHLEDSSLPAIPPQHRSPQDHGARLSSFASYWEPVFTDQYPAPNSHHLHLPAASPLHDPKGSRTPSSPSPPVSDSPTLRNSSLSQPLPGSPQPARKENSSASPTNLDKVDKGAWRRQQHLGTPRNGTVTTQSGQNTSSDKATGKHQNTVAAHSKTTKGDETPHGSTLQGALKSMHDLEVGALPFSDSPSPRGDLDLPGTGAGLMGSHTDMVEDTPDGHRVIQYQEFAVLSTEGGIALTADSKGHLSITVHNIPGGDTDGADTKNTTVTNRENVHNFRADTKNTMATNRENDQNHSDEPHRQSPVPFTPKSAGANKTQRSAVLKASDADNGIFEQIRSGVSSKTPNADSHHSPKSEGANTTTSFPVLAEGNKSNDRASGKSEPDTDTSGSLQADRHKTSGITPSASNESNNHTTTHHEADSSQHKDTAVLNTSNSTKSWIPRNPILSPSRALRAFTLFQRGFPFHTPSEHQHPGRPMQKEPERQTASRDVGQGEHTRRRREAGSHKVKSTLTKTTRPPLEQSPLLKHYMSKDLSIKRKEEPTNRGISFGNGKDRNMVAQNYSYVRLYSETAKPTGKLPRKLRDIEYTFSVPNLKLTKTGWKRQSPSEKRENNADTQRPENQPQNVKRFLTRGNPQTALRETRQFYAHYYPAHKLALTNSPHKLAQIHTPNHRRPHMKSQWSWPQAKNYAFSEPYLLSNGRTFKPNWYFTNTNRVRPTKNKATRKHADGQRTPKKIRPQTRQPVDSEPTDGIVANDGAGTQNSAPRTNQTWEPNPFSPVYWVKTDKDVTDRLLHNLSQVFRISFNIQFRSIGSEPASHNVQLPRVSPSHRRRRSQRYRTGPGHETYYLFPLGNIGWVTFYFHKHPYHVPRRPSVMAQY